MCREEVRLNRLLDLVGELAGQKDPGPVGLAQLDTLRPVTWTRREDWVSWDFVVQEPGHVYVEVLQGCGKGSGGSEVIFELGDQKLPMTVQDTGGFQNFVARDIGQVGLEKAGRYTLSVKPKTKPGLAVMDLRSVTLKPKRQ